MSRWSVALFGAALSCIGIAGCQCFGHKSCGPARPSCNTCAPGSGPGMLPSAPGAPMPLAPGQSTLPPTGATFPPPSGAGFPPPAFPGQVPPAPRGISGYAPPAPTPYESNWHGVPQPGVRLSPPEATAAEPPRDGVRLQTPFTPPAPLPSAPAVAEDRAASPAMPADIPQFAVVRDKITSGLKPFPDGFSWLKANGYRTVLHLRQPGEADSADRRVVENHGLKFLNLEVAPQTLAPASEEFNRIVSDPSNPPLFVYDNNGLLAGAMWYLYFRTVERMPEETARRKSALLGLKEETQGDSGTMWVAIQEYLRRQGR